MLDGLEHLGGGSETKESITKNRETTTSLQPVETRLAGQDVFWGAYEAHQVRN